MVYMYHSFPIHSSADGHLGCFHVLSIINSDAMNIGVHVSLSDLVSSVCMRASSYLTLRSELSKEKHVDRVRDLIRRDCPGREQQSKGTQENALPRAASIRFRGDGVSFRVVSGQSF